MKKLLLLLFLFLSIHVYSIDIVVHYLGHEEEPISVNSLELVVYQTLEVPSWVETYKWDFPFNDVNEDGDFGSGDTYYAIFCDENGDTLSTQKPPNQSIIYVKWKNVSENAFFCTVSINGYDENDFEYESDIHNLFVNIDIPSPTFVSGNNIPCYLPSFNISVEQMSDWTSLFTWTLPTGWSAVGHTGLVFDAGITIEVIPPSSTSTGNIQVKTKLTESDNSPQYSDSRTLSITTRNLPTVSITGENNVLCGETIRYTSSVQDASLNYSWQLPSGWTGTSSTHYIDATAYGSGNVQLTVTGCSDSKSDSESVTVDTFPDNLSIYGNSTICNFGTSYSIPNLPAGNSISWSSSSNISMVSAQGSNPCSFEANGSGVGSIDAILSNPCGSDTLHKDVWVGSPAARIVGLTEVAPYSSATYMAIPYYTCQLSSYSWTISSSLYAFAYSPNTMQSYEIETKGTLGTFYLYLTTTNACGSQNYSKSITVTSGGGGGVPRSVELPNIIIYPNPATELINVKVSENIIAEIDEKKSLKYEIVLYNSNQQIVYNKKSDDNQITINTRHLDNGFYYLHFIFKNEIIKEQVIISK